MYDPLISRYQRGSFVEPVVPPTADSTDDPLVCLQVNALWLPYILGALQQLAQPSTWITASPSALREILGQVQDLLADWENSGECDQMGTQDVTIAAGAAVGTHAVIFPHAFTDAPVVVVSASTGDYIAAPASITVTGFTATITANVPVIIDSTATVSWIAGPVSV